MSAKHIGGGYNSGATYSAVPLAADGAMQPAPLSIFVIAQNEAANIARCLNSVRGLSEDVLVVDGGSTDATREIARDCGARVVEHLWKGFADQKNFALQQCRHDWVLTLDADEELSPELYVELEKLRFRLPELWVRDRVGAWAMPRRVRYEGRWICHGDWNPDFVVRLFRREGTSYEGVVHESVRHEGETRRLKNLIFHYSYRDLEDHLARLEKYSTLWAQSKVAQGKRVGALAPSLRALWRFLRGYLLKAGFLDGKLGLRIALLGASETRLKYQKLRDLVSQYTAENNRIS